MNVRRYIPNGARRLVRRTMASPARFSYWAAARGILPTANHRRLLTLKNKHQGQRAFVIGNGPSLNKMDLSPLKNEITFGSNAFFLAHEQVGFIPTYYNVEDHLPAEDNAEVLNKLEGTTKIFAHDLQYCLKASPNTLYVFFDRYYRPSDKPNFPYFSANALKGVYWGGTVAYMSLQLAYYMGIREVYLIGVDLIYSVPANVTDGVILSYEADLNHFHPDYFGPGKRWHYPQVERMSRAFEHAGEFFRNNGGVIYNATLGGNLENLPRTDFIKVISQSH